LGACYVGWGSMIGSECGQSPEGSRRTCSRWWMAGAAGDALGAGVLWNGRNQARRRRNPDRIV